MSKDFTNFFKDKLLKLMNGQKKITDETIRILNPNVFLNFGTSNSFKFLGENFANFEIVTKISFGNVIITAGNYWETATPTLKKGFFILSDEFENIIPVEYENVAGKILKLKIMTTFNNKNIEDFLPEFLALKNNKSNFLFGIVKELNGDIKIVKFNNFTEYYFTPFTIFYFKDMKMNTSFIFDEAEPPIDFTNQVNTADYFKVEENFRNVDHIDVIFWKKINNLDSKVYLMSFQLDNFILKYISTPAGYVVHFVNDIPDLGWKYAFEFAAAATDNEAYIGFVIWASGAYSTITINPELKYILLFSTEQYYRTKWTDIPAIWPQRGDFLQVVFVDYDKVFIFNAAEIATPPPEQIRLKETILYFCKRLVPFDINNKPRDNNSILDEVIIPHLPEWDISLPFITWDHTPILEPYFKINRVWDATKKVFLVTVRGICYFPEPLKFYDCIGYIYYENGFPKLNPMYKEIKILSKMAKTDYILCLKQQNRIVTLAGIYQPPTPIQQFNYIKTQSTYNFGDIHSTPSFFTKIDNDLINFYIVHSIASFNDNALVADINVVDFTSNNNNLIYSTILQRNTMNNLDNNNWFLVSSTEQLIFNKSLTIEKNIFEEKNLNFIIGFLVNLVDKKILANEYAAQIIKLFITKNDITVLENLAITDIILTFKSGKTKKINILRYWVLDLVKKEMSIHFLLNILNKNDLPISYKLVSFNEITIYETEIKNFTSTNLLEIKHKIYYN